MSTDPQAKLDEARARLEVSQRLADDVEKHAQRLIETLVRETEQWQKAVSEAHSEFAAAGGRLDDRWDKMQTRVAAIAKLATGNLQQVGDTFAEHWTAGQAIWTDCATRLDTLQTAVSQQVTACGDSRDEHARFVGEGDAALQQMGIAAKQLAIVDVDARGKTFVGDATNVLAKKKEVMAGNAKQLSAVFGTADTRQDAWASAIETKRADFETEMDAEHRDFATALDGRIAELTKSATQTKEQIGNAVDAVNATAGRLIEGADDVVDVLNTTNIGLSTVVEIVEDAVKLCEEIVNAFDD